MSLKTTTFTKYQVYSEALGNFPQSKPLLINTINQYSYCVAEKDEEFRKALQGSDLLLPDGIAIVISTMFLSGKKINKIAGADLHQYLLRDLNEKHGRCFYLGASDSTLAKIQVKLRENYPNITVGAYSPPFKARFSKADNSRMVDEVNRFKPDVLFVGMTAPKQEKWAFAHKSQLDTGLICTIGAVFDFYAETVKRPSAFWVNLGMEWFIRLINEPKRMWRRYLYYGPVFAYHILRYKLFTTKGSDGI